MKGELFAQYLEGLWLYSLTDPQDYISQCLTPTKKSTACKGQGSMLDGILVLICSSDSFEKVSSWSRNCGPITCLQDGHQGNTSCQGYRCHSTSESTQIYVLYQWLNFSCLRRNCFSTYWHVPPIVTQEQGGHPGTIRLLPKRLSMALTSLQIKYRAELNTEMKCSENLRWQMTWSIHLTTQNRNKSSSMVLKKGADYQCTTKLNHNNKG